MDLGGFPFVAGLVTAPGRRLPAGNGAVFTNGCCRVSRRKVNVTGYSLLKEWGQETGARSKCRRSILQVGCFALGIWTVATAKR